MRRGFLAALVLAGACGSTPRPARVPDAGPAASAPFRDLGARGLDVTVKVTYAVREPGGASRTLVVAQEPPQRSFHQTGPDGDTLLISNDTGAYVACTPDACYEIPGLGGSPGAAGAAFVGMMALGYDAFRDLRTLPGYVDEGARTIAGRAAVCASWNPSFSDGSYRQCLDRQTGVALSFAFGGDGGETTVDATAVTEPSDADFAPTHPVQPLPTGFDTDIPAASPS